MAAVSFHSSFLMIHRGGFERMYLTYEEYRAFGGAMGEGDFALAELKARKRIDSMTQGRVARMAEVPAEVKAAMMEIIGVEQTFGAAAQASAPVAASFSTDGYSESYGGVDARAAAAYRALNRTVSALLYGVCDDSGTALAYAGVGDWGIGLGSRE